MRERGGGILLVVLGWLAFSATHPCPSSLYTLHPPVGRLRPLHDSSARGAVFLRLTSIVPFLHHTVLSNFKCAHPSTGRSREGHPVRVLRGP